MKLSISFHEESRKDRAHQSKRGAKQTREDQIGHPTDSAEKQHAEGSQNDEVVAKDSGYAGDDVGVDGRRQEFKVPIGDFALVDVSGVDGPPTLGDRKRPITDQCGDQN